MSTRAVIARKTKTGFKGVYHHWDGYPSGVGETLYDIYQHHFSKDIKAMLKVLIDDHPNGWSTINADWNKPPENMREKKTGDEVHGGPEYYPPGDGSGKPITHKNASGGGCEYAYVFDGNVMEIYSSYCDDAGQFKGQKMIGAFGMGDPKATWRKFATVDLNGVKPDFEKLDKGGYDA